MRYPVVVGPYALSEALLQRENAVERKREDVLRKILGGFGAAGFVGLVVAYAVGVNERALVSSAIVCGILLIAALIARPRLTRQLVVAYSFETDQLTITIQRDRTRPTVHTLPYRDIIGREDTQDAVILTKRDGSYFRVFRECFRSDDEMDTLLTNVSWRR